MIDVSKEPKKDNEALTVVIYHNLEDSEKPYSVGYHYVNPAGGMNGDNLGDTSTIPQALDLIAESIPYLKTLEVKMDQAPRVYAPPYCPQCCRPLKTVYYQERSTWEFNPETGRYENVEPGDTYGVVECCECEHEISDRGVLTEGPEKYRPE